MKYTLCYSTILSEKCAKKLYQKLDDENFQNLFFKICALFFLMSKKRVDKSYEKN